MSETNVPAGAVVPETKVILNEGAPVIPQVKQQLTSAMPPVDPVVPAAPEVAVEEEFVHSEYTGDAALDTAINTFVDITGASSADIQRATAKAIEYGNSDLVDETYIKEKFGKYAAQAIALAKQAVAYNVQQVEAQQKAAQTLAHQAAGSEAGWKQSVSVFNESAPASIKAAVKVLMDTGDVKSGVELLLNTVNGSGLLPTNNPTLQGGGALGSQGNALSAKQFQVELTKLREQVGNRSLENGPHAESYQNLLARRRTGKQLNIK